MESIHAHLKDTCWVTDNEFCSTTTEGTSYKIDWGRRPLTARLAREPTVRLRAIRFCRGINFVLYYRSLWPWSLWPLTVSLQNSYELLAELNRTRREVFGCSNCHKKSQFVWIRLVGKKFNGSPSVLVQRSTRTRKEEIKIVWINAPI